MKKLLLKLSSAFMLALVMAGGAQAIPLTNLLSGGSITVNSMLFDQWTLTGDTVNTNNIRVTDGGWGLQFDILNNEFLVTGDDTYAFLNLTFGFRVTALDSNQPIVGSSLKLTGFSSNYLPDGDNNLGISITDQVGTAFGGNNLGDSEVGADVLDDVKAHALLDTAAFLPQSEIFVTQNILVWAQDSTDSANLTQFTQRFSTVPEPATLALVSLGLLGMGIARRRLR